jgi:hypothetical protein
MKITIVQSPQPGAYGFAFSLGCALIGRRHHARSTTSAWSIHREQNPSGIGEIGESRCEFLWRFI